MQMPSLLVITSSYNWKDNWVCAFVIIVLLPHTTPNNLNIFAINSAYAMWEILFLFGFFSIFIQSS